MRNRDDREHIGREGGQERQSPGREREERERKHREQGGQQGDKPGRQQGGRQGDIPVTDRERGGEGGSSRRGGNR